MKHLSISQTYGRVLFAPKADARLYTSGRKHIKRIILKIHSQKFNIYCCQRGCIDTAGYIDRSAVVENHFFPFEGKDHVLASKGEAAREESVI